MDEELELDFDFDFDSSVLFDENPFVPNPTSPLHLSISSPGDIEFSFPVGPSDSQLEKSDHVEDGDKNDNATQDPMASVTVKGYLDGTYVIKEKMTQALRIFRESTKHHILAQIWAPVMKDNRCVLTTSGQPFVLNPCSDGLLQYRTVSLMYAFSVNAEEDSDLGLPGRVFQQKLPEWTPNVQYYSRQEYPRLTDAVHCNVQGSLAFPVFEPSQQSCVGVIELILMTSKVNYASEVEKVCQALEAVNLKSSEIPNQPIQQVFNEGYLSAIAEILEILTIIGEMHKLPLSQTWIPCLHQVYDGGLSKKCTNFNEFQTSQTCISTTEMAFYVIDSHIWGFRDACVEHHLQKGQGLPGMVFESHRSFFSRDITLFSKTEYPLAHYARLFGLTSCLAVCVSSSYTGKDEYILEFFLPSSCTNKNKQDAILDSIFSTLKQHSRTLKFFDEMELYEGQYHEITTEHVIRNCNSTFSKVSSRSKIPHKGITTSQVIELDNVNDALPNKLSRELLSDVYNEVENKMTNASLPYTKNMHTKIQNKKRRGKTEKTFSFEILQKYFSGSLRDAAKSLGVCPTTMKRICRQHGIARWPSRKINKVNRSLSKLNQIIESVHGVQDAFTLPILSTNPLTVGPKMLPVNTETSNLPQRNGRKSLSFNELQYRKHDRKLLIQLDDQGTSKARSISGEGGDIPETSIVSCQHNFPNDIHLNSQLSSNFQNRESNIDGPAQLVLVQDPIEPKICENFENIQELPPESKKEQFHSENVLMFVTIKATYKEDIVRFRLSVTSSTTKLNEELGKRFKLELGSFDIKYLDDDQEWISLSCDSDLQECLEVMKISNASIIRLLIVDSDDKSLKSL